MKDPVAAPGEASIAIVLGIAPAALSTLIRQARSAH